MIEFRRRDVGIETVGDGVAQDAKIVQIYGHGGRNGATDLPAGRPGAIQHTGHLFADDVAEVH